jgi:hypothetical protein
MKLSLGLFLMLFCTSALAAEKSAATKPARSTASSAIKAELPIQSMTDLCAELATVNDLSVRVKNFCKAEVEKARVAREKYEKEQKFNAKVKETIIASAGKSDTKIPLDKLKWETLGCHENYEKDGFVCSVQSTETSRSGGGGNEDIVSDESDDYDLPNGVLIHVDKNGRLKSGFRSITYECLGCAA